MSLSVSQRPFAVAATLRWLVVFVATLSLIACSARSSGSTTATAGTLASLSATASPSIAGSSPSPAPTSAGAQGPAAWDVQRAMAHLTMLANTIGPRVAGSDGERRASAYIADQFRADGYTVELMSFDFTGNRFKPGSVKSGSTSYEAVALDGSASGTVTGQAVYVGLADGPGIAGRPLNGKIAVADRGTTTFAEKYDNVKSFGAAALVILNNQSGQVNGRARQGGTIPVVSIAGEDAQAIRDAASRGDQLTVTAQAGDTTTAVNVIARKSATANCGMIIGGHFDSVAATGAANDNASGAATLLETARALATTAGPADGLCFAAWSGEESGLFGSAAFVAREQAAGRLPGLYVNLDVTGIGKDVQIIGGADVDQRALETAKSAGIPAERVALPPNTGSDHQSFEKAGVPVIYLTSGDFPTIHSPADVSKDIDPQEVDRIGRLTILLVQALLPPVAHAGGHS